MADAGDATGAGERSVREVEMAVVDDLAHRERVFLAGCIKTTTLADGAVAQEEMEEMDLLLKRLHFTDYESCLEEFEREVPDQDAFSAYADSITDEKARKIILETVYDLTLHEGVPDKSGETVFEQLNQLWSTRS